MSAARTFRVEGMTCQHCVDAVSGELSRLDGVRSVEVDLATGLVTLAADPSVTDDDVAIAVDEAGYSVAP